MDVSLLETDAFSAIVYKFGMSLILEMKDGLRVVTAFTAVMFIDLY